MIILFYILEKQEKELFIKGLILLQKNDSKLFASTKYSFSTTENRLLSYNIIEKKHAHDDVDEGHILLRFESYKYFQQYFFI